MLQHCEVLPTCPLLPWQRTWPVWRVTFVRWTWTTPWESPSSQRCETTPASLSRRSTEHRKYEADSLILSVVDIYASGVIQTAHPLHLLLSQAFDTSSLALSSANASAATAQEALWLRERLTAALELNVSLGAQQLTTINSTVERIRRKLLQAQQAAASVSSVQSDAARGHAHTHVYHHPSAD